MTAISPTGSQQPSNSAALPLVWKIFFAIFFTMAAGLIGFVTFQPILVLPRIDLAPGYRLTDHQGEQISNEMMRGSVVLYTFTHGGCTGECDRTTPIMQEVHEQLTAYDNQGIPVRLVTLSFDPANDTPDVLAEMAAAAGADGESWWYATGKEVEMRAIIGGGFGSYFEKREDGSFRFDQAFMIVDGTGLLRAKYRTEVPGADILMRDIDLLVNEAINSRGPSKVAYEAAHLFLCYPQ